MNATNILERNISEQHYVPDRRPAGNRQIPLGEVDSPVFYGSPKPVDADIVIPIYNEDVQLADSVSTLCSFLDRHARDLAPFSWNIVIADNASTDSSWQIAKSLCDWCPNQVRALHLARKGRGYALKQAWLSSRAAVVAYMDVDLSTDIGSTGSLILPLLQGGADIAFGSRLMPQSQVTRSPKREFISRTYNLMLRSYLAVSFHDAQCGFKAITAQAADALLPQVKDDEWFFDTELLVRAQQAGMTMLELPVRWVEDAGSTVDIPDTVKKDLEGMHRVREGMEARAVEELRVDLDSPAVWDQIRQHELRGSLLPAKEGDSHSRMQNPGKEAAAC
ncbi:dolichyl-phosphate beta-glucosyltransferase [Bifidobacterium asteroides]|uniref:dolichyl-phosphate beta-glucosyltransferase n=1 Tax=Bifidobacterium asteroides TaxID=1684 RepID=UPI003A80E0EE